MTTKTELQKELATLLRKVTELETRINEMPDEVACCKPIIERTKKYKYITYHFKACSDTDYGHVADSKSYAAYNYYPEDGVLCQQVADYLKRTRLFTRKAIEFAQGYKYKKGECNYFVCYCTFKNQFIKLFDCASKSLPTIYMSEKNADAFKEWCNAHRKELGYE